MLLMSQLSKDKMEMQMFAQGKYFHFQILYIQLSESEISRCHGLVFEAEKQIAKSGAYHKKCFFCIKCKHQLDATNFTNGPDNEVYCVYCYRVTPFTKTFSCSRLI